MSTLTFASFAYPRYAFMVPRNARQLKAGAHKRVMTYYRNEPAPVTCSAEYTFFYLNSDFAPGLRWQWCDEVNPRIDNRGWWLSEDGCGDKLRGVVFRLPGGRGFLAGCSMGERMASYIDTTRVIDNERDAANAADDMAEWMAEKEREYQEREREEQADAEIEEHFQCSEY